jgi:hypothetical protein
MDVSEGVRRDLPPAQPAEDVSGGVPRGGVDEDILDEIRR